MMTMADALAEKDPKNPNKAAFDTSRNGRKLGKNHKQMKAVVQFKVSV